MDDDDDQQHSAPTLGEKSVRTEAGRTPEIIETKTEPIPSVRANANIITNQGATTLKIPINNQRIPLPSISPRSSGNNQPSAIISNSINSSSNNNKDASVDTTTASSQLSQKGTTTRRDFHSLDDRQSPNGGLLSEADKLNCTNNPMQQSHSQVKSPSQKRQSWSASPSDPNGFHESSSLSTSNFITQVLLSSHELGHSRNYSVREDEDTAAAAANIVLGSRRKLKPENQSLIDKRNESSILEDFENYYSELAFLRLTGNFYQLVKILTIESVAEGSQELEDLNSLNYKVCLVADEKTVFNRVSKKNLLPLRSNQNGVGVGGGGGGGGADFSPLPSSNFLKSGVRAFARFGGESGYGGCFAFGSIMGSEVTVIPLNYNNNASNNPNTNNNNLNAEEYFNGEDAQFICSDNACYLIQFYNGPNYMVPRKDIYTDVVMLKQLNSLIPLNYSLASKSEQGDHHRNMVLTELESERVQMTPMKTVWLFLFSCIFELFFTGLFILLAIIENRASSLSGTPSSFGLNNLITTALSSASSQSVNSSSTEPDTQMRNRLCVLAALINFLLSARSLHLVARLFWNYRDGVMWHFTVKVIQCIVFDGYFISGANGMFLMALAWFIWLQRLLMIGMFFLRSPRNGGISSKPEHNCRFECVLNGVAAAREEPPRESTGKRKIIELRKLDTSLNLYGTTPEKTATVDDPIILATAASNNTRLNQPSGAFSDFMNSGSGGNNQQDPARGNETLLPLTPQSEAKKPSQLWVKKDDSESFSVFSKAGSESVSAFSKVPSVNFPPPALNNHVAASSINNSRTLPLLKRGQPRNILLKGNDNNGQSTTNGTVQNNNTKISNTFSQIFSKSTSLGSLASNLTSKLLREFNPNSQAFRSNPMNIPASHNLVLERSNVHCKYFTWFLVSLIIALICPLLFYETFRVLSNQNPMFRWDQLQVMKEARKSAIPQFLNGTSSSSDSPPRKVVLILLDGLRFDALTRDYHFSQLLKTIKDDSLVMPLFNQIPTMSVPNWMTIITGAPPMVTGVIGNLDSGNSPFENLFSVASEYGLVTGVTGSDWFAQLIQVFLANSQEASLNRVEMALDNLFSEIVQGNSSTLFNNNNSSGSSTNSSKVFTSFFGSTASDYLLADNQRFDSLFSALSNDPTEYDFFMAHLSAADNYGHLFGVDNPIQSYSDNSNDSKKSDSGYNTSSVPSSLYWKSVSLFARYLAKAIKEVDMNTILIITSDHGQVSRGGHGGLSEDLIKVPLIVYQKNSSLGKLDFSNFEFGEYGLADITPTISLLLGMPPPSTSFGSPIAPLLKLLTCGESNATCKKYNDLDSIWQTQQNILIQGVLQRLNFPPQIVNSSTAANVSPFSFITNTVKQGQSELDNWLSDIFIKRVRSNILVNTLVSGMFFVISFVILIEFTRHVTPIKLSFGEMRKSLPKQEVLCLFLSLLYLAIYLALMYSTFFAFWFLYGYRYHTLESTLIHHPIMIGPVLASVAVPSIVWQWIMNRIFVFCIHYYMGSGEFDCYSANHVIVEGAQKKGSSLDPVPGNSLSSSRSKTTPDSLGRRMFKFILIILCLYHPLNVSDLNQHRAPNKSKSQAVETVGSQEVNANNSPGNALRKLQKSQRKLRYSTILFYRKKRVSLLVMCKIQIYTLLLLVFVLFLLMGFVFPSFTGILNGWIRITTNGEFMVPMLMKDGWNMRFRALLTMWFLLPALATHSIMTALGLRQLMYSVLFLKDMR